MSQSNLAIVSLAIVAVCCVNSSPLDDYVNAPDPHFSYRHITTYNNSYYGVNIHVLNMTSQKWLSENESSNPIWTHQVFIVVPDDIYHTDTAFMFIGSGSNTDPLPENESSWETFDYSGLPENESSWDTFDYSGLPENESSWETFDYSGLPEPSDLELTRVIYLASLTDSVGALIKQVPNQPITFPDDPTQADRSEDAIMAWTWKKFLENTSNPDTILLLPMTKAVVRGLDLVSSYVTGLNGNIIDKFVVSGENKRGWTTWLTAAVDKRVVAIVPIAMDLLNLKKNLHHHFRSLGGWTFALSDYYEANISGQIDSPNFLLLQDIVDPLAYNARYKNILKLIITDVGDVIYLPDDSHYYYDLLEGPKYLRILPNGGWYTMFRKYDFQDILWHFYINFLEKKKFPSVTWVLSQTESGGKISVKTSRRPFDVTVFYAETANDTGRDFRMSVLDPLTHSLKDTRISWESSKANKTNDLEYEADVKRPAAGWSAFFIELSFNTYTPFSLTFTTEVNIIPDDFPVPDCSGDTCFGTLV